MRWTILLVLLCSCAVQRQGERIADKKLPRLYPPAVYVAQPLEPGRLRLIPALERASYAAAAAPSSAYGLTPGRPAATPLPASTTYLQDTARVDSLHRELQVEQLANQALRKRLTDTEADRDYWQDKNEQKFWTLIAMAVFGFLYILFKVLAARVRDTDA